MASTNRPPVLVAPRPTYFRPHPVMNPAIGNPRMNCPGPPRTGPPPGPAGLMQSRPQRPPIPMNGPSMPLSSAAGPLTSASSTVATSRSPNLENNRATVSNNVNSNNFSPLVITDSNQIPVDQEFVNHSRFDRNNVNAQSKRCRFALRDSTPQSDASSTNQGVSSSKPVFKLSPVPVKHGGARQRSPATRDSPERNAFTTDNEHQMRQQQHQHQQQLQHQHQQQHQLHPSDQLFQQQQYHQHQDYQHSEQNAISSQKPDYKTNGLNHLEQNLTPGASNQQSLGSSNRDWSNQQQHQQQHQLQQQPQRDYLPFKPPLMMETAEEIIDRALNNDASLRIHRGSLYRPRGGVLFLQRNANLNAKGPDGLCEDGYNWTEILHQEALSTSKGYTLDYRHFYITSTDGSRTSSKFRRESYTVNDVTLIALIGDEREAEIDLQAGTPSKKSYSSSSLPRSHRFDRRTGSRTDLRGSTLVMSDRPTSLDRAELKLRAMRDQTRLRQQQQQHHHLVPPKSAPPMLVRNFMGRALSPQPPMPICFDSQSELLSVAKEVASGKLVKNLTLFPSIQITLIHPEMTREFENACQLLYNEPGLGDLDAAGGGHGESDMGIRLFYDISFSLGKLYATVLTYTNACYEGNPIFPLAINLHETKFKSSHQLFWARIVGDIPALQKHRFPLFIDDAEPAVHLAVRMQAPNLVQLEGWTHRFRDIDDHLRAKGYGDEAIAYFKACVCYLLSAKSKQAMHDRFRKEFEFIWPKDFVHYYRGKLLPRSGRLGQWAMSKMNVNEIQFLSPHTNPQESFHRTCRHFVGWQHLSLSQLIRAFDILFLYYVAECKKGDNGALCVKDILRPYFFQNQRSSLGYRVPHPSLICDYIQEQYPQSHRPGVSDMYSSGAAAAAAAGLGPTPMLAYGSSRQQFAAATTGESFEDVLQIESALERMFSEKPSDLDTNLDLAFGCLPDEFGADSSSEASDRIFSKRYLHNSALKRMAGLQNVQVPSPAPNGRVPSPAPPDVPHLTFHHSTTTTTTTSHSQPVVSHAGETSQSSASLRLAHRSLSTIPEVPSESRSFPHLRHRTQQQQQQQRPQLQHQQTINNLPTISKTESLGGYPPDLLAHSNLQEHSFDSSIVTEGHYDASFESEVPPVDEAIIKEAAAVFSSAASTALASTTTSSGNNQNGNNKGPAQQPMSSRSMPPSHTTSTATAATSEERTWMGGGGWSASNVTSASAAPNPLANKSGLMLWKKVQHYVVVGGAFVNAAAAAGPPANGASAGGAPNSNNGGSQAQDGTRQTFNS